ncbi:PspC domain-containing protein [Rhodococcus sp. NPDC058505]|uniref:ATP-binding protein n=1 Tax=unclassified Rhodococcus (in: high G+C Gram-positive bacteria) TaxID=192944 RepID=UPI00365CA971
MQPIPRVQVPGEVTHPRLERRVGGRVIGGVAGGVADHLGVDVFKVRVAFVLLGGLAGAGIVAYGLLWIFTPPGSDTERPSPAERRRALGLAVLGLALSGGLALLVSGTAAEVLVPVAVVAVGAALVWREYDSNGPRSVFGLPQGSTVLTWARVLGGISLIVLGLGVVVLAQVDLASLQSSLLAAVVTLVGIGLLTVPLWLRLWRDLGKERAARIRNEEREEIASHLHDSVLQTLALIQKQSDRPQEVLRLARGQERELRRWLFGEGEAAHASLAEALRTIAGEVEDQHGIAVQTVTVGDVRLDVPEEESGLPKEAVAAVLGATREALVNAAKHSGESTVDLFAEAEATQVNVYVRDRGVGFDPAAIPTDRQGLAKSIRARVERRGGDVSVESAIGRGTEIRIGMPLGGPETGDDADLEWSKQAEPPSSSATPKEQYR